MSSKITYRTARQSTEVLSAAQPRQSQQGWYQVSKCSHFGKRSKGVFGKDFGMIGSRMPASESLLPTNIGHDPEVYEQQLVIPRPLTWRACRSF